MTESLRSRAEQPPENIAIQKMNALLAAEAEKDPQLFANPASITEAMRRVLAKLSEEDRLDVWEEFQRRPDVRFNGEVLVALADLQRSAKKSGFDIKA